MPHRIHQQVDAVGEVELLIDAAEVIVHGVLADTQAPGDAQVLGGRVTNDGANKFPLAQRQPCMFRLRRIDPERYMPGRGITGKPIDPGSVQPDVAMVDFDDGLDNRLR
ncbi:hypothetical protein D3C75_1007250 [compost metagenome]